MCGVNGYRKGEERFGPFMSLAYWLGAKSPDMRKLYRFVLHDLSRAGFGSILDVGTGTGDVPIALARLPHWDNAGIFAIDPSPDMLRIARMRSRGLGITFAAGSSRRIPFDKGFDVIMASLSFHHWADREGALKYLSGFLNSGGEIRIYEVDRERLSGLRRMVAAQHSLAEGELRALAAPSGLRVKGVLRSGGFIRVTFARRAGFRKG